MELSFQQYQDLLELSQQLGFVEAAAAAKAPVRYADAVRDWVADGMHADMAWYANALDKRLDLDLVLPGCQSVFVLITPYASQPCELAGKKLARYACGDDYHDVLKKKLWTMIDHLKNDFPQANFRPYVDTGPILERYWAQEAGLGFIGKNGCLINRQWGSTVFISCIVTDLIMPYGQTHPSFCGACTACLDACPTDAIVKPGVVDSRKCISYLNIEQRGPFPDQTPDFEDWIFGCDICQEVCPWTTKFAKDPVLDAFQPRAVYSQLESHDLAEIEQERFSRIFSKSAIKRAKMAGIKRNLAHLETTHLKTADEQTEASDDC